MENKEINKAIDDMVDVITTSSKAIGEALKTISEKVLEKTSSDNDTESNFWQDMQNMIDQDIEMNPDHDEDDLDRAINNIWDRFRKEINNI